MHFWSLVLIIVNCDDLEFKDMYSCSDNFCDYTFSICSVNVLILSSACTTLTIRQLFPHFPGKLLPWRKRDFGSNIRKSTQSFRKKSLFVVRGVQGKRLWKRRALSKLQRSVHVWVSRKEDLLLKSWSTHTEMSQSQRDSALIVCNIH